MLKNGLDFTKPSMEQRAYRAYTKHGRLINGHHVGKSLQWMLEKMSWKISQRKSQLFNWSA